MIVERGKAIFLMSVVKVVLCILFFGVGVCRVEAVDLLQLQNRIKSVTEITRRATVALVSEKGNTGSGVIVNRSGLVLTAAHVVEGCEEMYVVFPDGRLAKARVLGANYTRDAAMVQLTEAGTYPYVELGQSDTLRVGDFVMALGHAKGFDPDRKAPIRIGRLCTDGKQRFLISECTLIGGDSGGPLFDLNGRLVGIHSSIGNRLDINNHVPISVFLKDWEALLAGRQWGQLGIHPMADPESPILGFSMMEVLGVDGIVVEDVIENSPADQAGIRVGDVVTFMDNRSLNNVRDMLRELGRHRPGETVNLVVVRKGVSYRAELTFGRRGDLISGSKHRSR